VHRDTQHARHLNEGCRDIVAITDERDRAAAAIAPPLTHRQRVGERLAGVLLVGQRVDDVKVAPCGSQRGRLLLREGSDDQCTDPSLQVASDVLQWLPDTLR
jgi:hypothetical protein